jgi:hypothetical protein
MDMDVKGYRAAWMEIAEDLRLEAPAMREKFADLTDRAMMAKKTVKGKDING